MQPICLSALFFMFVSNTNISKELHTALEKTPKYIAIKEHVQTPPFTVSLRQQLNNGLDSLNVYCTITANNAFIASGDLKIQIALEAEHIVEPKSTKRRNRFHTFYRTILALKDLPVKWDNQEKYALNFSTPLPHNTKDMRHISMRACLWSSNYANQIQAAASIPLQMPNDLVAEGVQGLELLNCSNTAEPIIIFKNDGTAVLNTCKISYKYDHRNNQTIQWSGELQPGHATVVNLPPSTLAKGKHRFEFSLSEPNGQQEFLRDNNTYILEEFYVIDLIPLPIALNFQSTAKNGTATPFILHNSRSNPVKWDLKNGSSSFGKPGKALSLNLTRTEPGAQNELVLPLSNIDQINRPQLRFNYAYFQQNHGNDDQLEIMVSTDCGTSWSSIWSKQGSNLATAFPAAAPFKTPGRKDWKNIRFDLYEVSRQPEMLLKFVLTSDAGNAFFLDDINISSDTSAIETTLLLSPNPCNGVAQFTINNAFNEEYTLKVLNTAGHIVFVELIDVTSNTFSDTINLLHLPNGVYPVALYNKSGLIGKPKQLVVQKP